MKKLCFSDYILLFALIVIGGFHEYISCLLTVAMSVYLLITFRKKRKLRIHKNFLTSAVIAVTAGYGLTCFWAVDQGTAFIGFMKYMPLLLYLICLQQEEEKTRIPELLPWLGAIMTVVSAIGMQIPALSVWFSVAGRLAGFFQYPNSFALFLLVCELLLLEKKDKKHWDYILLAILLLGLLYTGSRTAFVIAALANGGMLIVLSRRRIRMLLILAGAAVGMFVFLWLLGPAMGLERYLTISFAESTFVGRLLYWTDALPLLSANPVGMGHLGYFFTQQSVQTGVYAVTYVHNDFLQLLLDVGLVPAGLFLAMLVTWFVRKGSAANKIIVGAVCLHSFFEFNFQFVGIFMLLLLLLSRDGCDKVQVKKPGVFLKGMLPVAALAGVYLGAALMLAHWGFREVSDTLYPYNTHNKLTMMSQTTDLERAEQLADEILEQNTSFYAPYSIKAVCSYSQGDFASFIRYKEAVFERNPFEQTEYEDYCRKLMIGVGLYQNIGDQQSAAVCQNQMIEAQNRLRANKDRLSLLGSMIADQPVTELSEEVQYYIAQIGK